MGPQPLSHVRITKPLDFGVGAITSRPDMAVLVMDVIATWTVIDGMIVKGVAQFLNADYRAVNSMLEAIVNAEARQTAIESAAKEVLPDDDFKLYQAVGSVVRGSRKKRNEFAHHYWGTCEDVPDALLLVNPKYLHQVTAKGLEFHKTILTKPAGEWSVADMPGVEPANIFMYRKTDLEQCVGDAKKAHGCVQRLNLELWPAPFGNQELTANARTELLALPEIQLQLQKLSRGSAQ